MSAYLRACLCDEAARLYDYVNIGFCLAVLAITVGLGGFNFIGAHAFESTYQAIRYYTPEQRIDTPKVAKVAPKNAQKHAQQHGQQHVQKHKKAKDSLQNIVGKG